LPEVGDTLQHPEWLVALHEAGHAVAALRKLVKPVEISIEPEGPLLGRVLYGRFGTADELEFEELGLSRFERLMREAVIFASGIAAETLIGGAETSSGAADDLERLVVLVERMLPEVPEMTREALETSIGGESGRVVLSCDREIRALATALLAQRKLSYEQALEIVCEASATPRRSL
jgi:hypothetical protein